MSEKDGSILHNIKKWYLKTSEKNWIRIHFKLTFVDNSDFVLKFFHSKK